LKRGRVVWLPAVVVAALVVSACSSSSRPTRGGTLTIAIANPPQPFDPGTSGSGGQAIGLDLAYEPLIRAKSDGSYVPALATSWKYVGSGSTEFEMTLRSGAKFADGTPVDASAVKATLDYYLKAQGLLKHLLTGISRIDAPNSTTVLVHLNAPNPILPAVFSQMTNYGDVISPAGLRNPKQLGTNTFGAGAYTLDPTQTVTDDHYTYLKNPKYWNPSAQHYSKIVVKVITDANATVQALKTHQVNISLETSPDVVSQARNAGLQVVKGAPTVYTLFLMDRAGQVVPALGQLAVRQALNYATDRVSIAKALGSDIYAPIDQIAAQGEQGYDPALANEYPYDPTKAKQLLAQAGYPNGFSLTLLLYNVPTTYSTVDQAIAQQWKQLGVNVTIKNDGVNVAQAVGDLASKKYPVISFKLSGGMFANAMQNFHPSSILDPFKSSDPAITQAINSLAGGPADQADMLSQAVNKAVVDQAWFVPVVSTGSYMFAQGVANLGGFGQDTFAADVLDWVSK
jgi:peptide/nickel transport system substrate-binding protein